MSGEPNLAALRSAARARGLRLTRGRDGRCVLHRGDPQAWEARGELAFLARVLEPPDSRPSWARGRR
jgi:hypothetical protein